MFIYRIEYTYHLLTNFMNNKADGRVRDFIDNVDVYMKQVQYLLDHKNI